MLLSQTITYRPIDLDTDAAIAYAQYRQAGLATYGDPARVMRPQSYWKALNNRCEEFPDGHLLAFLGDERLGQLELQVPYGLSEGYINLFYVRPQYRRLGFGRLLHQHAEEYFRSWEADTITLHVSPGNRAAVAFYRRLGYQFIETEGELWKMELEF